jgi:hypothetical protein
MTTGTLVNTGLLSILIFALPLNVVLFPFNNIFAVGEAVKAPVVLLNELIESVLFTLPSKL